MDDHADFVGGYLTALQAVNTGLMMVLRDHGILTPAQIDEVFAKADQLAETVILRVGKAVSVDFGRHTIECIEQLRAASRKD